MKFSCVTSLHPSLHIELIQFIVKLTFSYSLCVVQEMYLFLTCIIVSKFEINVCLFIRNISITCMYQYLMALNNEL